MKAENVNCYSSTNLAHHSSKRISEKIMQFKWRLKLKPTLTASGHLYEFRSAAMSLTLFQSEAQWISTSTEALYLKAITE
jgi:hypothetical protein